MAPKRDEEVDEVRLEPGADCGGLHDFVLSELPTREFELGSDEPISAVILLVLAGPTVGDEEELVIIVENGAGVGLG